MSHNIRKARVGAIVGACSCAVATFFFLFGDLIKHPSFDAITNDHVAAFAALMVAITAGHYATEEWRERRFVLAVGAGICAAIATWWVVSASASRTITKNAEAVSVVKTANNDRARNVRDMDKAEARAELARKAIDAREIEAEAARKALSTECRSGKGPACKGLIESEAVARQSVREAREAAKAADQAYEAARKSVSDAPAPRDENGYYKAMARGYAALPFMASTNVEALAERLAILVPLGLAVIAELGTIVLSNIARHPSPGYVPRVRVTEPDPIEPIEPVRQRITRLRPDDAEAIRKALASGPKNNNALAAAMGVNPGEATKRRRALGHMLREEKIGRETLISLRATH